MASAPFCAAVEDDVVLIKARVVGNFGDDLQVELIAGRQVTKVFVGAGSVVITPIDLVADHSFRANLATMRHHHSR